MTDVRKATHVVDTQGVKHKIASKWGISAEGVLAKPSEGGFGCICEDGTRISMWDANSYSIENVITEEGWYWIRRPGWEHNSWHIAYFDGVWLREFGLVSGTGTMWKDKFPEFVGPIVPPA